MEDKKRDAARKLRALEEELDEERRGKQSALSAKKKLESELQEQADAIEAAHRSKEEFARQLKKYQVCPRTKTLKYTADKLDVVF